MNLISSRQGNVFWHKSGVDTADNYLCAREHLFVISYGLMHRLPAVSKEAGNIDLVWLPGNGLTATHEFNCISLKLMVRGELEQPQRWIPRVVGWFN